jgi:hypothetical protein
MEEIEKIEWSAPEYEEKERGKDWFWALGVIVITSSIAAIIYKNYFFAVLIILGGALLGLFAIKKPDEIFYEINGKGLKIMSRVYTYGNIHSFNIVEDGNKTLLLIKSERFFMPVVSLPIEKDMAKKIHSIFLSKNIPEEEIKEHASEKIMEILGF